MSDEITLKWSDFQNNIEFSFAEARKELDFCDVTLLCEDDQLEAHRIVLSSGSTLFQRILKKAKHPHPLIFLKGFTKADMDPIIDFLYNGETNVARGKLEQFIKIAKELEIIGVMDHDEDIQTNNLKPHELEPVPIKQDIVEFITSAEEGEELENEAEMKSIIEPTKHNHSSKILNSELSTIQNYTPHINSDVENEDELNEFFCRKKKSEVWKHYDRLDPSSAKCKVCGKTIKTTDSNTKGLWSHDCVKKLLGNRNIYSKKVIETELEPYFM